MFGIPPAHLGLVVRDHRRWITDKELWEDVVALRPGRIRSGVRRCRPNGTIFFPTQIPLVISNVVPGAEMIVFAA